MKTLPAVFRRFAPYYRHLGALKLPFIGGVLAGLLYAVASGAGLPLVTKLVLPILFDGGVIEGELDWHEEWIRSWSEGIPRERLLLIVCLWIPLMFLIRGIAGYLNAFLIQYTGLRVVEQVRTDVFSKLQTLPLAFFHRNRSGDILARLMSDTEILRQVVANASNDLIRQPATLLFAAITLVTLAFQNRSVMTALVVLMSVPICVLLIRTVGKKLSRRAKALQREGGDLTAVLAESLQSPLEIRAYGLEERQIETFRKRIRKMLKLSLKVVKYRQAISPSIDVVAATGFSLALYAGAKSGMTLEQFTAVGVALYIAYEPVKKLGMVHSLLKQGESAADRIEHILHEPDTMPDPEKPVKMPELRESLRFANVSFSYGEGPVLKDIDLTVRVGEVVALVGASGAGKTTFVQLIPRLYDPTEGQVLFDGVDLRQVRKADLRAKIAVVPQMPALFAGSIADNIRLGKPGATDEEVRIAARRAHAEEFIVQLEKGYDTEVGERGTSLSGGQRQRIAIARAFLKDAPVLILDEATSALDSESEARVQDALAHLVEGRTTFLIAHRFSTISIADRIVFFSDGQIVADGTHEDLYARFEPYRKMYDRQSL